MRGVFGKALRALTRLERIQSADKIAFDGARRRLHACSHAFFPLSPHALHWKMNGQILSAPFTSTDTD
jgi:hypothetical protein